MRDSFSPGCERAIAVAHHYATGNGAAAVDARHLALGLFQEPDGVAFSLATNCGCRLDDWKFRQTTPVGAVPTEPMTLAAERAIRHARSLAREFLVDRTVTSELLLYAVLETDPVLAGELADNGLDLKKLRQLVMDPLTAPIPLVDSTNVAQKASNKTSIAHGDELYRILDAGGNRAREALRVLEDFCRFGNNDSATTRELKSLRHELAALLARFPRPQLMSARDTLNDVGTTIATDQEYQRTSLTDVVAANMRRLQEALRSLEEFGKVHDPQLGRLFEALRYRSYTLEKRLSTGDTMQHRLGNARLYLLFSASATRRPAIEVLQAAIEGGVQIVQLREKTMADRELLALAHQVREITRATNTPFIMNDRVDMALACGADGVHLGQDDMPADLARNIVGRKMWIGVSTHDVHQLQQAIAAGADYVGVGPTFPSMTKSFTYLAGLDFIRQSRDCSIPAFALGGVNLDNIDSVIDAGGSRVAVSSAILNSDDPATAARQLRQRLDAGANR